ncbi:carboxylesterase [Aspergillus avenaceus]|uniref:Carboxylic ester hydrolase n=1 Tax=Aspergillus avenaceus TaxID=36643 RepID=A0A5N6U523_ASPAV|nr:carboxylesterase [Aspergillus avenaceus]
MRLLNPLTLFAALTTATLIVHTDTGIYTGLHNPEYPSVREFLSIPYAKPPLASRRWLPPQPLPESNETHPPAALPPACPQYVTKRPTVFNQLATDFLIDNGNQSVTAGVSARHASEACLYLAIWTPANATTSSNLPVLVFYPGGAFQRGGVPVPYQLPPAWIARTQGHIVVTVNYRLNIMGFPNAAGLHDQNLGLLDQRLALEWVRSNIGAFGGDAAAITLWGQSAGSMSADWHTYAFHDDLIARATFSQSGTGLKTIPSDDYKHTNFTFVAKNLGCESDDPKQELECMRRVPVSKLQDFIGRYTDNGTEPALEFGPIVDDEVIFSDYPARAAKGLIANVPAIISNAANEGAALYKFPSDNITAGPWQPAINAVTLDDWLCASANTSVVRHNAGLKTYRYQYAGAFENISPFSWLGAYHCSDLPMLFGTYPSHNVSKVESETSRVMQDYLFAFASDPEHGLERMGWMPFEPGADGGGVMKRFGGSQGPEEDVFGDEVQGACWGRGEYDPFP